MKWIRKILAPARGALLRMRPPDERGRVQHHRRRLDRPAHLPRVRGKAMIPPPHSVQLTASLTLYAGLTVCAAFGLGLLTLGIRALWRGRDAHRTNAAAEPTITAEQ